MTFISRAGKCNRELAGKCRTILKCTIHTNPNEEKNINAYKKSLIKSLHCLVFIFPNKCFISAKKGPAQAILLLPNFAKNHQSNIARAGPFFGLSTVPLLSNDCHISVF